MTTGGKNLKYISENIINWPNLVQFKQ